MGTVCMCSIDMAHHSPGLSLLSRSWLERLFLDVVRNGFGSIDLNGLGAWLQIESREA